MSQANLREHYNELIALTKLYLLREYEPKAWKLCEDETFAYFKARAQKQQEKKPLPPLPKIEVTPSQIETTQPTIEPKPPKKEKPQKASEPVAFQLSPPKENQEVDLSPIKHTLEKLFPHLTLLPSPPDDREAKKMLLYKQSTYHVAILTFDQKAHPFLMNVSNAIDQECVPAKVISAQRIEKEKGWNTFLSTPHLKLIIASDYELYSFPELMKHYREVPKEAKAYLANIPLLLLADLSLYLKEPKLKPALWRAIRQQLKDV